MSTTSVNNAGSSTRELEADIICSECSKCPENIFCYSYQVSPAGTTSCAEVCLNNVSEK